MDGRFEAVGSDVLAIRRAIADAAKAPKAAIDVDARPIDDTHMTVHLAAQIPATVVVEEQVEVLVALVQDGLTTDVQRGENRGRRLAHSAVVRSLSAVAVFKPPVRSIDTTATLSVAAGWNLHHMRIGRIPPGTPEPADCWRRRGLPRVKYHDRFLAGSFVTSVLLTS